VELQENGIRFENTSKEFFGKFVLSDINIFLEEGLIHAIVGENGAGKSTLMNILSGVHIPTTGTVYINGCDAGIKTPKDAEHLGIGMVYQHFMLIDILTVWQNIILGNEPRKIISINKKEAFARINNTCVKYGLSLDLNKPAGLLTVGEQQRVEILKVLYRDAKYIVFDEPTSVLTPGEIDSFLDSIRQLKKLGKTIIFISHKLEEVISIADTITILRDGKNQGKFDPANIKMSDIVHKMVGRNIDLGHRLKNENTDKEILRIDNISTIRKTFNCALNQLTLNVCRGEIVGVAGVDGNGQFELVNTLLGIEPPLAGDIFLDGKSIKGKSTAELRRERIACIPPDRQNQGLVLPETIVRNATLGCEDHTFLKNGFFLSVRKSRGKVADLITKYNVKCNNLDQAIKDLSGGNQQKIILARECEWKGTQLILAVNPTHGLDIGAIEFVYRKLNEYKMEGKAILLISTELSEILTLSDRIAVLSRGTIVYSVENENVNIETIGAYMAGIKGKTA
jgi:simple sugar transport system ATP-binding protein